MSARSDTRSVAAAAPRNGAGAAPDPTTDETQQTSLTVEDVVSEEELVRIAPEWQNLSERSDTALLFNTFEWVYACWKHFHKARAAHDRAQLWVLAVRDTESLRAVVPLWVETRQVLGVRTRIARFLGEGPSDYGDVLLAPPRSAVLEAVVTHLAAHGERWDLLDLRELFGGSPNVRALVETMLRRGWWVAQSDDSPCQTVPIEGGWESYYRGRFNSKRRRDQRREWRSLQETGALSQEVLVGAARIRELCDAFSEVQAAHVDASEQRPGEFNDPVFRPFLEEMLAKAAARGWLRMPILRRDGVPVAYYIAFLYKGRYYVYNTAHRADCQRFGAGKLLMLHMLEQFFAEGDGVIDYLRGAEPYKAIWAERTVINIRLRAARPGLRAVAGRLLWFYLIPGCQERAPLLHRFLIVVSEEGLKGLATRLLRRLLRRG